MHSFFKSFISEHLHPLNSPIRIDKRSRIVFDKLVASAFARTGSGEIITRPVATEVGVDDNVVLGEVRRRAVRTEGEVCVWRAPGGGFWCVGQSVGRNRALAPEPGADTVWGPAHCYEPAWQTAFAENVEKTT